MDSNRDEAIRAKEIAEKKLVEKDISGAKRFASRAQSLFPGLEGLSQFEEVLSVYAAGERKVNGEVDWYGVLGVDPLADYETLGKKYRKLALVLHPDKNKAVGADGAFKILTQAWSLLSDKVKKSVYDQKRNIRRTPKYEVIDLKPAAGIQKNGMNDFMNASSSSAKNSSAPSNPQTGPAPNTSNGTTFWTICKRCMIQYEYVMIYLNKNLLCPHCRQPFLATEMPPPFQKRKHQKQQSGNPLSNTTSDSGRNFTSTPEKETPGFSHVHSMNRESIPQNSSFKVGGSRSIPTLPTDAAQPMYTSLSMGDDSKRGREEVFSGRINVEDVGKEKNDPNSNVPILSKEEKFSKKKRVDERMVTLGRKDFLNQTPPSVAVSKSNIDSGNQMHRSETAKLFTPRTNKSKSSNEFDPESRNLLAEKARMEIRKKLQEWNAAKSTMSSSRKVNKEIEKAIPTVSVNSVVAGLMKARNRNTSIVGEHLSIQPQNSSLASVATCSDSKSTKAISISGAHTKAKQIVTMTVPDPEFYDFDKDRIEEVFAKNQVWAAYDDEDGMPRYYAIIHDVISRKPFKVRISWLNSKSNSELGPLNWVGSGFTKTCGDFRIGKHVNKKTLNSFSHRVEWSKGSRGVIRIFPKKGDIWAVYRYWSSDWNERTEDNVIRQYDMVEVVEDYNEEQGVSVIPLVKVAGFRSVFQQHLDSSKVYTIPRQELFRLSHQVPSFLLTGQETKSVPEGSRELDTAAMPLELLQIIKEPREAECGRTYGETSGMGDADAMMISRDAEDVVTERNSHVVEENSGEEHCGRHQ